MGWRLGWNPSAPHYQGLVGTSEWSVELTQAEFEDFCRLLLQLAETMTQASLELMDSEMLAIEAQSEALWMEARGFPQAFSLSFILLQSRRAEGSWPPSVTPALIQGVQMLQFF
nr:DUF1818 family protein [Petrachloros mirabilis]